MFIMFFCSRVMNPASMYQVNVILSPKGAPEKELQLQSRCLESEVCSLAPEGILVKTQAAGVCHTDLHLWHGHYKVSVSIALKQSQYLPHNYPIVYQKAAVILNCVLHPL